MNKSLLAVLLAVVALFTAVPILLILFLVPMRTNTTVGAGLNNQVPSDVSALTIHDRLSIQLTWTAVNQGTATYILQRSDDDGRTWRDIAELEQGAASYIDSDGLADEAAYLYRIRAFDAEGGSGYSNTASATATDLPRPTPTP